MTPVLFALVVVTALGMAYMNGFHDASNAVSTTIATRTLRESAALMMAAVLNLLGALLGMMLIMVTAQWAIDLLGLAPLLEATDGAPDRLGAAMLAIMLTTILWDLITWWFGMPASTWHAYFGATLGASLVLGATAPSLPNAAAGTILGRASAADVNALRRRKSRRVCVGTAE